MFKRRGTPFVLLLVGPTTTTTLLLNLRVKTPPFVFLSFLFLPYFSLHYISSHLILRSSSSAIYTKTLRIHLLISSFIHGLVDKITGGEIHLRFPLHLASLLLLRRRIVRLRRRKKSRRLDGDRGREEQRGGSKFGEILRGGV